MYMQFGCSASELSIHVSDQPVAPSSGSVVELDRLTLGLEQVSAWYGQVVPTTMSPLVERLDLLGVVGPVLADVLVLLLQQLDRRVELLLVELVRIGDSQIRLVRAQVQRRVGDVDRVVVRGDLAAELVAALSKTTSHDVGAGLTSSGCTSSTFAATVVRDPVVDAVERVVRLVLQRVGDVVVVRRSGRCSPAARRRPRTGDRWRRPTRTRRRSCPVRISCTISSEVLPILMLTWQPVSFSKSVTQSTFGSDEPSST